MAPRFKIAHLFRRLRAAEMKLAKEVFHNTLPPLSVIGVTDGLGDGNTIWTVDRAFFDFMQSGPPATLSDLAFLLNFGEAVRWDLSDVRSLHVAVPGYYDRACDVFMHEMTHVWQFRRGFNVKTESLVAQKIGAGYEFPDGREEPWLNYNVEQQARIVEIWNSERTDDGEDHVLFPYIHFIIRGEGEYRAKPFKLPNGVQADELWMMDLPQLTVLWLMEKGNSDPSFEPVMETKRDDSFLVILQGDVLFDFNKPDLKPESIPFLERAAGTIRSKIGPRFKDVLINGHTDNKGPLSVNQPLSEARAKSVADWFFARGYLAPARTKTEGFADTVPVAPNTTAAGRAKNRRVEIYLENN
jgi:flagellar motor protein MotB